jgi:AraC-like DNA-binding protein
VLWLFPGVRHAYLPDPTGWRQAWVLFDGPAAQAYESLGRLGRDRPVATPRDPAGTTRAFARVLGLCAADDPGPDVVPALHELILAVTRAEPDGVDARLVSRLRGLALSGGSVADHATALGVSVRRLRAAARATGSTPREIVLTTRLNEAKALLTGTDLSVAAVARRVGYDDAAYFSRLFASRTGLPPRTFRRRAPG